MDILNRAINQAGRTTKWPSSAANLSPKPQTLKYTH